MLDFTDDTVTLSMDEYQSLLEDSNFLKALEWAGVDNWDGYDLARESLTETD